MTHLSRTAAAVLVAGLVATTAPSAHAVLVQRSDDDRVIRTGSCSDGARWKIKAKEDDGRVEVEVEAEIDSDRVGQRWTWVLSHDGSRSAAGSARTAGRSGSFSVERKLVDAPGTDTFAFRATHRGQVCVATVRYPG